MDQISTTIDGQTNAGTLQGWILTASCWLAAVGAVLIAPILPLMQAHFAAVPHADILVVIVLVVPALTIAIFSPLVGILTDIFGRKRLYVAALLIYAIAGVAPFWLENIYAIIGSRFVVGAMEAAITTIATALTADYFLGKAREKWLAIQAGSASVIAVFMFALGGLLGGQAFGWRTPFLVYGATIVLLPVVAFLLWEPTHAVGQSSDAVERRMPFPWKTIWHVCLLTIVAAIMFFVVPIQISFLLNARGAKDPAMIGLGSAIANIGVPVGSYLFHRLSRLSIIGLLTSAFCLLAVGFLAIAVTTNPTLTIMAAFVACIGGGIALPLLITWTVALLPYAQRGRGTGAFTSCFFLGNFVSPIIIAAVGANVGGLNAAVGVMAALSGIAGLIAAIFLIGRRGPIGPVGAIRIGG